MSDDLWSLFGPHGRGALVTLKRDGRPQLSTIDFLVDAERRMLRLSSREGLAKVANLRRDPRVSLYVSRPDGSAYAVAEGVADVTPVSADPHDATVAELVDVYRGIQGEHPDWDEYRAAMVTDRRVVVRVRVERLYGWKP
jgi:PPOX class probable F420-dependent enzyme